MITLREILLENLANAKENDYSFDGWSNEAIAEDMIECRDIGDSFSIEEIITELDSIRG